MVKINKTMISRKIKDSAVVQRKRGKGVEEIKLKISPSFVDEYIGFVLAGIDQNVGCIAEKVYHNGKRKTLMKKDIVQFFGFADSNTLQGNER